MAYYENLKSGTSDTQPGMAQDATQTPVKWQLFYTMQQHWANTHHSATTSQCAINTALTETTAQGGQCWLERWQIVVCILRHWLNTAL